MKKALYASVLCLAIVSCKDAPQASQTTQTETMSSAIKPIGKDTIVGLKGCEIANFDGTTYTYASAKVKVSPQQELGDSIEINGTAVPVEIGDYFNGIYKNYMLIDQGEGSVRTVKVWDISAQKIIFKDTYVGDLSLSEDKLHFLNPLDLTKVKLSKPIKCPKESEWKKSGLGIGYGQPSAYDLIQKTLIQTGDITCYPQS